MLKEIPLLPKLTELFCSNWLTSIPDLPNLRILNDEIVTTKIDIDAILFHDESELDCIICYSSENVYKTKCNHTFHKSCLHTWLTNHRECPYCRAIIV
jgi:hypothetical protein